MKWTKKELTNQIEVHFEEKLDFDLHDFHELPRLKNLHDVIVKGNGHYDCSTQRFEVDLDLAGEMVVPCAVSLEDICLPFETTAHEVFSFLNTSDEDVHECKKDFLDLYSVVFQLILAEVPLKAVKEGIEYPKGDGWEVLTEMEYRNRTRSEIDPRLAKLKDFKFEEN